MFVPLKNSNRNLKLNKTIIFRDNQNIPQLLSKPVDIIVKSVDGYISLKYIDSLLNTKF